MLKTCSIQNVFYFVAHSYYYHDESGCYYNIQYIKTSNNILTVRSGAGETISCERINEYNNRQKKIIHFEEVGLTRKE